MTDPAKKSVSVAVVSYEYELKSQARGFHWNWRIKVTHGRFYFIAGYGSIALGILAFFLLPKGNFSPFVIVLVGSIWAFRYNYLWWQFRRSVLKSPIYGKPINWSFFEEGLEISAGLEPTRYDWDKNAETYTTSEGFLFYSSARCMWIPRSAVFSIGNARALEDLLFRKTSNRKL